MTAIMRVRFTVANNGSKDLVTTYWRPGTSGGSTADATDALARVRAWFNAVKASTVSVCVFTPVVACDMIEDTTGHLVGSFTGTSPLAIAGTAAGDNLPQQVCWLIKWLTSSVVNNRRLQGRTFLPGPGEGMNTAAGVPNPSDVTTHTNGALSILTGGSTASFPVVWNRPLYDDAKPPNLLRNGTSMAITSAQCDPLKWGSQRNRRYH